MNKFPKPWHVATQSQPCPICGADGCLFAGPHSDPMAVICTRTSTTRPIGTVGFLHVLNGKLPPWTPWRVAPSPTDKAGRPGGCLRIFMGAAHASRLLIVQAAVMPIAKVNRKK